MSVTPTEEGWQLADLPEPRIRFRPGPGGEMASEWAAYMLGLWWQARDKRMTFAAAVQATATHFMVGDDEP